MNNNDREQWVLNEWHLYCWWQRSGQSMIKFIRENKQEIDQIIRQNLSKKPIK